MSNSSITLSQRGMINAYLEEGLSLGKIALRLHHPKSGIWYDVHRMKHYNPDKAQIDEEQKRSHCGRHTILSSFKASTIFNELMRHEPPELIAHGLGIATSSIYNWIYRHWVYGVEPSLLPEHGKRRRRKRNHRGRFFIRRLITERPKGANDRTEFGHWEADTILSPHNGNTKAGLVTFVERKTRVLWSMKIPNRTHQAFAWAMRIFMKHFGKYVKSITTDHGREFAHNYILAMVYHLRFYFCHAHSPQERGTNERFNRKLRARFPKKTDFSKVSQNEVFDAVYEINTQPMETLNWKTPIEAFHDELNKLRNRSKHF